MGEQSEYLTVPDFADKAGVTKAGVYARIKSQELEEYIKLDNGLKMVSVDAIRLFTPRKQGKVDRVELTELSKLELEVKYSRELIERLETTIQTMQGQLDILNRQLQEKDIQLASKDIQLANKDKQLDELSDLVKTVTALAEQAQSLADQAQRLDAVSKVKGLVEDTEKDTKRWYQFWK